MTSQDFVKLALRLATMVAFALAFSEIMARPMMSRLLWHQTLQSRAAAVIQGS